MMDRVEPRTPEATFDKLATLLSEALGSRIGSLMPSLAEAIAPVKPETLDACNRLALDRIRDFASSWAADLERDLAAYPLFWGGAPAWQGPPTQTTLDDQVARAIRAPVPDDQVQEAWSDDSHRPADWKECGSRAPSSNDEIFGVCHTAAVGIASMYQWLVTKHLPNEDTFNDNIYYNGIWNDKLLNNYSAPVLKDHAVEEKDIRFDQAVIMRLFNKLEGSCPPKMQSWSSN